MTKSIRSLAIVAHLIEAHVLFVQEGDFFMERKQERERGAYFYF
jgi:hypothetical protein